MKSTGRSFVILISVSTIFLSSVSVFADVSAGIYNYFVWWKPAFSSVYKGFDPGTAIMSGPMVNWSFSENWSISLVAIMSLKDFHVDYKAGEGTDVLSNDWSVRFRSDFGRLDIDVSISYRFTAYCRLFGGVKHMGTDYTGDTYEGVVTYMGSTDIYDDAIGAIKLDGATGLGAGMNFTFPVNQSFFITCAGSLLYYPLYKIENEVISGPSNPGIPSTRFGYNEYTYYYRGYGCNVSLGMSYYVQSLGISIAPGGRFQFTKLTQTSGDKLELGNDYYYGLTLAALYHF